MPGGKGQGCPGASNQGGVPSGNKGKQAGKVQSVRQQYLTGQGPGWNSQQAGTNGNEGYIWDAKTSTIRWPDGTPTRSPAALAAEAEVLNDEQAVQVAVDVFAGTQSMGQVYRHRKGVTYIPLDGKGAVYSAAQRKMVKNVQFDIMKETPAQTMAIVVSGMKQRKRG